MARISSWAIPQKVKAIWQEKRVIILIALLLVALIPIYNFATDGDSSVNRIQNGSFETFADRLNGKNYVQTVSNAGDYWKSTTYDATRKIEVLRQNTNTYVSGAKLTPRDGMVAAELNAEEESTLYQVVDTEPSSLYEWGLSHTARTPSDTMALIIGPDQEVAPSKNIGQGYDKGDLNLANPPLRIGYKYGRDQMMQMVTWLKSNGLIPNYEEQGVANGGKPIVLYSKKFAPEGTFQNNDDNQPFSMTSSSIYSERWCIWVITDKKNVDSAKNVVWSDYGLNAQGNSEEGLDLGAYYLYSVPSGQEKTIFAFTSVENDAINGQEYPDPTLGNLLDDVNFRLYRSLSASVTDNGKAWVEEGSDGSGSGSVIGDTAGHEVTSTSGVKTYVEDGASLTIQSIVKSEDLDTVTFAGVFCTIGDEVSFISGSDERWEITTDENGNRVFTTTIDNVTKAVDLHFVFIRSPRVLYDSNGGAPYDCNQIESADPSDSPNVYNFKPIVDESNADVPIKYIAPYSGHAAQGPDGPNKDAWKFMGWKLFDNNSFLEELISGNHSIAYNASFDGENNRFIVIGEGESFSENPTYTTEGVEWDTTAEPIYSKNAPGLTLVAQWRWRQTFEPKTNKGTGLVESDEGGSVEVTSVSGVDDPNYDAEYTNKGGKAYYASVNETVSVTATPKEGFYFDGWYDENNKQVTQNQTLTYTESKEGINKYYAHFIKLFEQRYIRQIQVDGVWTDLGEDEMTSDAYLDRVSLIERIGAPASSTATNNNNYGLVGWYDEDGNKVPDSMLINGGKTIRYTITGDATYYARFAPTSTIKFKIQKYSPDGVLDQSSTSEKYQGYGYLDLYSGFGVPGDVISNKAYPGMGFYFDGWYDGPGEDASKVDFVDPTNTELILPAVEESETTYYARFKSRTDTKYLVRHYFKNWNGATNNIYKEVKNYTYYGVTDSYVLPDLIDLTMDPLMEGYRYEKGRVLTRISASGSTVISIYYIKSPAVLEYVANPPEGTEATGQVDPQDGYVDYPVAVSENGEGGFAIEGYRFNGWNTMADGSGTYYYPTNEYILLDKESGEAENPNVLFAQWVPDTAAEYTVEHYLVNADETEATLESSLTLAALAGETVSAVPKTIAGHVFAPDYSNNEMVTTASGIVESDGSLVLKLYYLPESDKITYKANSGIGEDVVRTEGLVIGKTVLVENGDDLFTRPGYRFNGWNTLPDGKGTRYAVGQEYTLTPGDDVLYAQWVQRTDTIYTVYHYLVASDGLSCTLADIGTAELGKEVLTGKTDTFVTAQQKSITGYTYNDNFDSNGMKTASKGKIAGDGSLVLRLYYIPNQAKLIYDPNGADASQYQVIGKFGESTLIEDGMFSRPGYIFDGWNESADGTGEEVAVGDIYTFLSDEHIIYAMWKFDPSQCADDMHFQKVWIDSDGSLIDFNKATDQESSSRLSIDQIDAMLKVSVDGGNTWTDAIKRNENGEEQPVTAEDLKLLKNDQGTLFQEGVGDIYWSKTYRTDEWYLPLYDENGSMLKYKLVEDDSNLPSGWKQYTGEISYSSSRAIITNPVTGEPLSLDFYSYDDTHTITKKEYQENVYVINYKEPVPVSLVVSKIDGTNSTAEEKIPLVGARFALYEASEDGEKTITYDEDGTKVTVKCKELGEGTTSLTANGKEAIVSFEDKLFYGKEYYLVETKAPIGYRVKGGPIKIVFQDEALALINGYEKAVSNDQISVELANYLNLSMPTTGISLTGQVYSALGIFIMLVALVLLTGSKLGSRRKRGGEIR